MLCNLIYINNIEIGALLSSWPGWHINCFKKGIRRLEMRDAEKRILIIDPDTKVRKGLASYLKNEKYYVETGKSLTDAIKKISEGCFNCLIMDVDLPEMKGYEAVSILKNLDPQLKVIMTAGKNSKRLEARIREQDIFFYFIKSFGTDELKLAIKNAFSQ
jgi:DNA-binding NtrC family response regulator